MASLQLPPADEQLEFLEKVKQGVGMLTAAFALGWTPAKLKLMMADPEFKDCYQQALTMQIESAEEVLYRLVSRGNMRAIEMFLYNRSPDRWAPPTQKVKISSEKKVEITVRDSAVEAAKALIAERGAISAIQQGAIEAHVRDSD